MSRFHVAHTQKNLEILLNFAQLSKSIFFLSSANLMQPIPTQKHVPIPSLCPNWYRIRIANETNSSTRRVSFGYCGTREDPWYLQVCWKNLISLCVNSWFGRLRVRQHRGSWQHVLPSHAAPSLNCGCLRLQALEDSLMVSIFLPTVTIADMPQIFSSIMAQPLCRTCARVLVCWLDGLCHEAPCLRGGCWCCRKDTWVPQWPLISNDQPLCMCCCWRLWDRNFIGLRPMKTCLESLELFL